MVKKNRQYLCQGCDYGLPGGVTKGGNILCTAVGKVIPAVPYTRGRRFESCEHRPVQGTRQAFLIDLAREARRRGHSSPTELKEVELQLKEKHGL